MSRAAAPPKKTGFMSGLKSGLGNMGTGLSQGVGSLGTGISKGVGSVGTGLSKGVGSVGTGLSKGVGAVGTGFQAGYNNTVGTALDATGLKKKSDAMAKLRTHFEALQDGSMVIIIDNSQESHPIDQPITGKIKVNQQGAFQASALTLELHGYQTSSFFEQASAGQAAINSFSAPTSQSKTVFAEVQTIAEFVEGSSLSGQSEYAFNMRLPDSVTESLMIQFAENSFLSMTYYLRAQLVPQNLGDPDQQDQMSLHTANCVLNLCQAQSEEHRQTQQAVVRNQVLS